MGDVGKRNRRRVKENKVAGREVCQRWLWEGGDLGLLCWRYRNVVCLSVKIQALCLQLLWDGLEMTYMSGFFGFSRAPPPLLSSYP